jgi:hypothetical protein
MVNRPAGTNALEFAVVSGLRAAQLMRGCTPRIDDISHKVITTAQLKWRPAKSRAFPCPAFRPSDRFLTRPLRRSRDLKQLLLAHKLMMKGLTALVVP